MFFFLLFLHFYSFSSFSPVLSSPLLFYLSSPFLLEITQNNPQGLTCIKRQHNQPGLFVRIHMVNTVLIVVRFYFSDLILLQWLDITTVVGCYYSSQMLLQWQDVTTVVRHYCSGKMLLQWLDVTTVVRFYYSGQILLQW